MQRINFTPLPNIVFDKWLSELSPAEFKVFIAICRKTYGWHKEQDRISLSQLIKMTALSERGIINSLSKLEGYNLIAKTKQQLKNNGATSNLYSINLQEDNKQTALSATNPSELSSEPPLKSVQRQKKLLTKEINTISVQSSKSSSKQQTNEISFDFDKQEFINITDKDLQQWRIAYPSTNISQEIAKAQEWLKSEPTKAKQKKKFRRYLTNWLSRADEKKFNQSSYKAQGINIYANKQQAKQDNKAFLQRFATFLAGRTNDPVKANGIKLLDHCFLDKSKALTINYLLPLEEIKEIIKEKYNINVKI